MLLSDVKLFINRAFQMLSNCRSVGFTLRSPWLRTQLKWFSIGSWLKFRWLKDLKPCFFKIFQQRMKPSIAAMRFLKEGTSFDGFFVILSTNLILHNLALASLKNGKWYDTSVIGNPYGSGLSPGPWPFNASSNLLKNLMTSDVVVAVFGNILIPMVVS